MNEIKINHIFQGIVFTLIISDFDQQRHPAYQSKPGDKCFIVYFRSIRGKFAYNGILTDELLKDAERSRVLDMLCEATYHAYTRAIDKRG